MATVRQYPRYEEIAGRLQHTQQVWWLFSVLAGLLAVFSVAALYFVSCVLIDGLLVSLPAMVRLVLLVGWPIAIVGAVILLMVRPMRYQRTTASTARRIEQEHTELGNDLINAIQLAEEPDPVSPYMVSQAIEQSAERARSVRFEESGQREGWRERLWLNLCGPKDLVLQGAVLAGILIVMFAYQAIAPNGYSYAVGRFFRPRDFVPRVGSVAIVKVEPEDVIRTQGSAVRVVATIRNPDGEAYRGKVFYREGNSPEIAFPLIANEEKVEYSYEFTDVQSTFTYRLEIGDTQTSRYTVTVEEKPLMTGLTLVYQYPPYTKLPERTVDQKTGDIEAVQYSHVKLKIHMNKAIEEGTLEFRKTGTIRCQPTGEDNDVMGVMDVTVSDQYRILLQDKHGYRNENPRWNEVRSIPDNPPRVSIERPAKASVAVPPGSTVKVVVRASDDFGLKQVCLMRVTPGQTGEGESTLQKWTELANPKEMRGEFQWKLDADKYKPGDVLFYRAMARDGRDVTWNKQTRGPQTTYTAGKYQIKIVDPDAALDEKLESLDEIRRSLFAILKRQRDARVAAQPLKTIQVLSTLQKRARQTADEQQGIQKETLGLVKKMGAKDEVMRHLRVAVTNLAMKHMTVAVTRAQEVVKLDDPAKGPDAAQRLTAIQDEIIRLLSRILNVVRDETSSTLKRKKKRPGGDLPEDVADKLRDLKKELEEFIKEQRKVIEATKNLAKKPVDDYTEEEKQQLKELAATEDKFERFMKEKHSDLSKVPKQDFSNPTLLQELIEIQTELKQAKDALTKKTVDLAVPLEQLGAEMAKELTTHIEKWLPEKADREKWSQEEPLDSSMTEAPMAELPKELEDLVGELTEEEEDLMQDAQDVSSSWADSLDKGAGWDTLDGPISNFSAQGATGNQLPNTNEVGGRAGEGRSAKSTGEFVGEEAVGKGGRRTPSRLTPDPFEKGVVKDRSKDPVGGASGGGKESGQGGEGLEGPAPPPLKRQLHRLRGKQADLRNRAERIALKNFGVTQFHETKWKELLAEMGKVETQLVPARYRALLRKRPILLKQLRQQKMQLAGQTEVQEDKSITIPRDLQEDILNGMQEKGPKGWDELNRKYFETLAEGGSS